MAERRMMAKSIVLSDAFLDMPMSARNLYFTFLACGDDDGFVNNPKSIMRQTGASMDDFRILLGKKYIIAFESGVIVIRHWRIHNYIQKDRYKPSECISEKSMISVNEKGMYTECIQDVSSSDTQVRIAKASIVEANNLTILTDGLSHSGECDDPNSGKARPKSQRQTVMDAWNSLGLTRIEKIVDGTQRCTFLKKRIKDYGLDGVLKAIENIRNSDFLMGKTEKGFNTTFDWFIRPNNFPKVLDGNYSKDKPKTGKGPEDDIIAQFWNEVTTDER